MQRLPLRANPSEVGLSQQLFTDAEIEENISQGFAMKKTADKTVKPKTERRIMLMAVVLMAAAVVVMIIGMVWMQGEIRSLLNTLKKFKALQGNT